MLYPSIDKLLNIVDSKYRLPNLDNIHNNLSNRIETIKNNNYVLPTISDNNINDEQSLNIALILITLLIWKKSNSKYFMS